MVRVARHAAASALLVLAMAACGGGGGSGDSGNNSPPPPPPPSATVSGVAGKGLLLNAIVNFYSVSNGVASTTALATVRTDSATGAFTSPVTSAGPVLVTVTTDANTKMLDELSGTAVTAPTGLVLHAVLDSLTNVKPIAVTPLTEMTYSIAKSASGGLSVANIDAAESAVDTAFLNGVSSLNTQPIDVKNYKSAPAAQQALSKLLVAFAVAANQGSATDASGAACNGADYNSRLVCMIGGLGTLLKLDSSNKPTLQQVANYLGAAYNQIDTGAVTVAGGQTPAALGLDTSTQAEKSFETTVSTQTGLTGYIPGASPLANTKGLFADVRTNILDQATTQTFGLAPVAAAVADDFKNNVHPVLGNTAAALAAAKIGSDLVAASSQAVGGGPTNYLAVMAGVGFAGGNLYVTESAADQVVQVTPAGVVTPFAGTAWTPGSADGTGAAARFSTPAGVAGDAAGNLYVVDQANKSIRKITPQGVVTTIASQFNTPAGIAVDTVRNVIYVSDAGDATIRKVASDGTVSLYAGQAGLFGPNDGKPGKFTLPVGLAVDAAGTLYVGDFSRVRKVAPDGTITTLAGSTVQGAVDGTGFAAGFKFAIGLTLDGSGNLYVADRGNSTIRKVTNLGGGVNTGVVTTIAGVAGLTGNTDANGTAARFDLPNGIVTDGAGNLYVSDAANRAVRKIDGSGNVTTVAHSLAAYVDSAVGTFCGYDPQELGTANNAALCRYGVSGTPMLMTVTQTGTGTYDIKTQPLTGTLNTSPALGSNVVLSGYTPSTTIPALDASFTNTNPAWAASGPIYVTATGGQLTTALSLTLSNDWNSTANSGTVSASGTLSNGSGGISLLHATLGADSTLTLQNLLLDQLAKQFPNLSAASSIQGTLDITELTTSSFMYAAKASVGAPTFDKSGKLGIPASIGLTGSVAQVGTGGTTSPLFNGSLSLAFQGAAGFDVTQPISSTNFVTAQVQMSGLLNLTGSRQLSLSATVNATQVVATPDHPDSLTATYTYVTPMGTALLNATAQYDTTNGYTATITNNAGVKATLSKTPTGALTGNVTANGTATASIAGSTISYSDGSTESLF